MTTWLKETDIERIEDYDRESGEKIVRYQLKIMSSGIRIPVGLDDVALQAHETAVMNEAMIMFERWMEKFVFERLIKSHDYTIESDDFATLRLFISEWKDDGDLLVVCSPEDIIDILGKGIYQKIVEKLSEKPIDRESIKVDFGFVMEE
jgi:hypothetical protein